MLSLGITLHRFSLRSEKFIIIGNPYSHPKLYHRKIEVEELCFAQDTIMDEGCSFSVFNSEFCLVTGSELSNRTVEVAKIVFSLQLIKGQSPMTETIPKNLGILQHINHLIMSLSKI